MRRLATNQDAGLCLGPSRGDAVVPSASQERAPCDRVALLRRRQSVHALLAACDQITRDNVKNLRIVWRRPAVSDQLTQAFPELRAEQLPAIDADRHRRRALHAERARPGRRVRRRDRQDRVGTGALRANARGGDRIVDARRRLLARRRAATPTSESSRFAANICTRSTPRPGKPVPGFGDQGRASLHFQENQPLAARFNDSTGPLVVGNVVVVTGNTAGAGDTGHVQERKRRPRMSAASTRGAASCCGRFTSCRGPGNSASTPGATSRGRLPAISARGTR